MNSPNSITSAPEAEFNSVDGSVELSPSRFFSQLRAAEVIQSLDRIQIQVEGFEVR